MNVKYVAAGTITTLGAVTAGSAIAAAMTTATVAAVAYATLAIGAGAVLNASIIARMDNRSTTAEAYFTAVKDYTWVTVPAAMQTLARSAFDALIQGISEGLSRAISRHIAGDSIV